MLRSRDPDASSVLLQAIVPTRFSWLAISRTILQAVASQIRILPRFVPTEI
jgi:hypothetical protein